jgi:hypothetical protein
VIFDGPAPLIDAFRAQRAGSPPPPRLRRDTIFSAYGPDANTPQKMRVARDWDGSGLTMANYATRHGISERTLRTWRSIYAPAVSVRGARITVEKAIGQLQAVLNGLPPEPAPVECNTPSRQDQERALGSPAQVPPRTPPRPTANPRSRPEATPVPPLAPIRTSFDWNGS